MKGALYLSVTQESNTLFAEGFETQAERVYEEELSSSTLKADSKVGEYRSGKTTLKLEFIGSCALPPLVVRNSLPLAFGFPRQKPRLTALNTSP